MRSRKLSSNAPTSEQEAIALPHTARSDVQAAPSRTGDNVSATDAQLWLLLLLLFLGQSQLHHPQRNELTAPPECALAVRYSSR